MSFQDKSKEVQTEEESFLWTFEITSFFVTWRHWFPLLEEEESLIQIS